MVLRQEEIVQEVVNAEQAVAIQGDHALTDIQPALVLKMPERLGELLEDIGAELLPEVGTYLSMS